MVLLERIGVVLLLVAAFVPRVQEFFSPWDREFEGFQGTFFGVCAINYERLGLGAFGGYPTLNIDLPADPEGPAYRYPNHPPTVPLLTWASAKLLAPEGWNEAWREGEPPPEGTEAAFRFPFLVLHMLGLAALWWAVRQASGAQIAMLTLAVAAMIPISILYGFLVNYENPCLPFVLLGCGFHARWLRSGRGRDLGGAGLAFLIGSAVTFTPAFFVPPLVAQTLFSRGWRRAFVEGATLSVGALVPLVAHGVWVKMALPGEASEAVLSRASRMLKPLFEGEAPLVEWLQRQGIRLDYFLSTPIALAAAAGLGLLLVRLARREKREEGAPLRLSLGLPLFAGGALYLFAFYRHTWDGDRTDNGQTVFVLNLVPAAAVLAATAISALTPWLARLRAGFAPMVLVVGLVGLRGLDRAGELRHQWFAPGPADNPALTEGPPTPLPSTIGPGISEVLPAGAVGIYPRGLSYTPAIAYYAWRTLVPASEETYELAIAVIEGMHGLVDAPRYIIVPKNPPPYARASVEAVRARVAESFEMIDETDEWEMWPAF